MANLSGEPVLGLGKKLSKSRVVVVRDKRVQDTSGKVQDKAILRRLVDMGMQKLTGASTPAKAWQSLFKPGDVVGIKVNCIAGRVLAPHVELVEAIINGLKSVGISEENIIIWDRYNRDLVKGGFEINLDRNGVKCYGAEEAGYEDKRIRVGTITTKFTKILTRQCIAIINVPVLKTSRRCGVTISLKNWLGAVNNPQAFHPHNCNPYVADLNMVDVIKSKTRLIICDALRPLYNGGPQNNRKYRWNYSGIIVSRDLVAVDYVGTKIIQAKRDEVRPPVWAIEPSPDYIATAADEYHRLGKADSKEIDLVQIEGV